MGMLNTVDREEIKFLMDFDYNNVLGRLRYVLGKEAHFFADIRVKQKEVSWSIKDDVNYVSYTEASESEKMVIKEATGEIINKLSAIISGDSLIGPHTDKILSYPSPQYIFYAYRNGVIDVVLTGWGCSNIGGKEDVGTKEEEIADVNQESSEIETSNETVVSTEDGDCEFHEEPAEEALNHEDGSTTIDEDNLNDDVEVSDSVQNDDYEYTSEWLRENTKIHGWLTFYLFAIGLGGIISAVVPIATFDLANYAGNIWLGSVDILIGVCLLAIAIYTIFAFCRRRPNAVFYGKMYVILVIVTNVISLVRR